MVKRLIAIVVIAVVHFATFVLLLKTGRTALAAPLTLPLVPATSWLGLTSSATAYGVLCANRLFCGYVIVLAFIAIDGHRRKRFSAK